MKVTALRSFKYGGKRYATGEQFEMTEPHARIFVKNRAVIQSPVEGPKAGLVDTRAASSVRNTKGRYRRRDMRADEV